MSSKTASASSAANDSQSNSVASNATHEVDKTCVVCFKIVDIFSVGECDHPVCYECSTSNTHFCLVRPVAAAEVTFFGDCFFSDRNACAVQTERMPDMPSNQSKSDFHIGYNAVS